MKYYLAPMEGITGYVFRRVHYRHFEAFDRYYAPFIVADQTNTFKTKEHNDLLATHNEGMVLIPQILTNKATDFIHTAHKIASLGYQEVNLNLGCPSGTVVSKKRGSGFLAFPEELDRFLNEIYEKTSVAISIKTRLGKENLEEFEALLKIYNQYPVKELIVHPRLQKELYKGHAHREVLKEVFERAAMPVCYNGDLFEWNDIQEVLSLCPEVPALMFGRGILMNPALLNVIKGKGHLEAKALKAFHDDLCEDYASVLFGDRNVLFKMKELWYYLAQSFEGGEKQLKKIKKADNLMAYNEAVHQLFQEVNLKSFQNMIL